jgi:hypothetical protein
MPSGRPKGSPNKKTVKVVIPKELNIYYKPTESQQKIHDSKCKIRIVSCGRRFGKSLGAMGECIKYIAEHWNDKEKLQILWCAPTYQMAGRGVDSLKQMARDLIDAKIVEVKGISPVVATMNGHKIYFLSSDNQNGLRGYFWDLIVLDEAAFLSDSVYQEVILPTTLDKDARILAISSPAGESGWFYSQAMKADGIDIDFFKFSTYDNPHIKKEVIENMRKQMPIQSFKQEIMAEFISGADALIHNLEGCDSKHICTCDDRKIITMDLARYIDYTVLMSWCPVCHHITNFQRMQLLDWSIQKGKIVNFYNQNNGYKLIFDCNSIGDVMQSALQGESIELIPVKITSASKNPMVLGMIMALEQRKILWDFNKWDGVIYKELKTFRPTLTDAGNLSYQAMPGNHDDAVCALWLLATEANKDQSKPFFIDIGELSKSIEEPKEEPAPIFRWMNEGDDD